MFSELSTARFDHLLPLVRSVPQDPMLHMVLEGNRPGQIFVDRPANPSVALIWIVYCTLTPCTDGTGQLH